jgi:microcystin-dependent protein
MPITINGTGTVTGITAGGLPDGTVIDTTLATSAIQLVAPAEAIAFVCQNTAPTGWLKANGDAVSRTTYANLFAALGTTFGAGNGSTTFNLPDLRGEFLRGWADGRAVDTGRTLGSAQGEGTQNHKHTMPMGFDSNAFYGWQDGGGNPIYGSEVQSGANRTSGTGTTQSGTTLRIAYTDQMRDINGETRPRNISLLAVIKF